MHVNHRYLLARCRSLAESPHPLVLDFGCGAGEFVEAGLRERLSIFGADVFYEGGCSRPAVAQKGLLGREVVEIRDGVLPFPTGMMDVVVANQVFEHVEDLSGALSEIHRVLKPGGVLITLFPARECLREGHCGIPLAHRFRRESRIRFAYMLAFRSLGLGHHKRNVSRRVWSRDFLAWLDRFTHYRARSEVHRLISRVFERVTFAESDYMQFRLKESRFAPLTPALCSLLTRHLLSWVSVRFGSTVVVARKAKELTANAPSPISLPAA